MKTNISLCLLLVVFLVACGHKASESESNEEQQAKGMTPVELTEAQVIRLNITIDSLTEHAFIGAMEVNGKLAVAPQSEATVTPQTGGNISQLLVRKGQTVQKGQIVALLSHPDFVGIQKQYLAAANRQKYLKKEFRRQAMMMSEGVGAGKDYDRTEAELQTANGELSMLAAQLRQMGISPAAVQKGKPRMTIAVRSPIRGTVEQVGVQTGQYVSPEMPMMRIVNTDHIFADLQVFQRDLPKVKVGQRVMLQASNSTVACQGKVSSIGQTFNDDTQTVGVRVMLEANRTGLIAGMYVRAKIATGVLPLKAVPAEAVIEEDGKTYVFTSAHSGKIWLFTPVEVRKIKEENGLVAIEPMKPATNLSRVAQSGAYYLLSEMKKGETGED